MSTKLKNRFTYGYNEADFKKFMRLAWMVLLSFGLMYMFFYNGRQNINLVMAEMAAGLGSRFGGDKQIARMGPGGEILLEGKNPSDIQIATLTPSVSYNTELCNKLGITVPEN